MLLARAIVVVDVLEKVRIILVIWSFLFIIIFSLNSTFFKIWEVCSLIRWLGWELNGEAYIHVIKIIQSIQLFPELFIQIKF